MSETEESEALTSIHGTYTLATTPGEVDVNDPVVRHYLETLAEVALAVASRTKPCGDNK